MIFVIAFVQAAPNIGKFQTPAESPNMLAAAGAVISMVIGFFATAGAAGVDFGTASRNASDVNKGGLVGISLAVCKAAANAAGLPLYQYIGGANVCQVPMPIFGICLCGRYRDPGKTRWLKPSYEIIPYGATGFESAVEMAFDVQRAFTRLIVDRCGINVYRQTSLERSYDAFFLAGAIDDLPEATQEKITKVAGGKIPRPTDSEPATAGASGGAV